MIFPKLQKNEMQRIAALHETKILESNSYETFHQFIQLATILFKVPIAYISFIDIDKQHIVSAQGLAQNELNRNESFCAHTILQEDPLSCSDTTKDKRFEQNPLTVNKPRILSYNGIALHSVHGFRIGTFCVCDTITRVWSTNETKLLEQFGKTLERVISINNTEILHQQIAQLEKKIEAKNQYIRDVLKAPLQLKQRELKFSNKPILLSVCRLKLNGYSKWCESVDENLQLTFLNDYFKQMEALIHYHGGTIDYFDATGNLQFVVEATKTAPHSSKTVLQCAIEMQTEIEKLFQIYQKNNMNIVQLSIAISEGKAMVTYLGLPTQNGYHYMGAVLDTVQEMSKLGVANQILLCENSYNNCNGLVGSATSILLQLPHSTNPIKLFEFQHKTELKKPNDLCA